MGEYKYYYTENPYTYHFDQLVKFGMCNKDKKLYFHELLKFTSDVAVDDFVQRNLSRETLAENKIAILVSRVSFRIHRMPVENEHITLNTWEEKNEPLQFIRAYEIVNAETGEKLVSGLSTWLLVNLENRRIMPVKNFTLRPAVEYVSEHDCYAPSKISEPENMTLIATRKIAYTDLDANGHTNNSRYAAFVFDALPEEYLNKEFCDIKMNYSKEAMFGQNIDIYFSENTEEKILTVIGKCEGAVSFECQLFWK